MSAEEIEAQARAWMSSIDPAEKVGARHHTVPRFYLARFADRREQLRVRDRATGAASLRSIKDLAVKDFYTIVHVEGHLDSSFEQLFSVIEGQAAGVLEAHLNSFTKPRPFRDDERSWLDTFVAFQFIRGNRERRNIELMADYSVKIVNQHILSEPNLRELEFAPHQNDHMRMMHGLAELVYECLADRPVTIVTLDAPLLVTCDEPVILPAPDWFTEPTTAELVSAPRRITSEGVPQEDLIHFQSRSGVGIADSEEVVMPLSPRSALLYGPRGSSPMHCRYRLVGAAARDFGQAAVELAFDSALDWVAAHPDHRTFADKKMPPPKPIMTILDGGTVMSRQLREPIRRRPRRLKHGSHQPED